VADEGQKQTKDLPARQRSLSVFALLAAGCAGLLFALLTPPFQVPDEPAHFFRAFALAEGRVAAQRRPGAWGTELPVAVLDLSREFADQLAFHPEVRTSYAAIALALDRPLAPGARTFVDFRNSALFSPLPYLPQAAGIWLARRLTDRALPLLYAARLANLSAALLLLGLALRHLRAAQLPAIVCALSPLSLALLASASGDAFHLTACWLATATLVELALDPQPSLAGGRLGLIASALFLLGAAKPVYAPLGLLLLALPRPLSRSPPARRAQLVGALALLAGMALSLGFAAGLDLPLRPGIGLDPGRQGRELVAHPLHALGMLGTELVTHTPRYVAQMLGHRLGWLDTPLPRLWLAGALLALLASLSLRIETEPAVAPRLRLWAAVAAGASTGLVILSQWLLWTPAGAPQIEGVQGRYLLPLAWIGAIALASPRRLPPGRRAAIALAAWLVLGLGVALATLLRRYYA